MNSMLHSFATLARSVRVDLGPRKTGHSFGTVLIEGARRVLYCEHTLTGKVVLAVAVVRLVCRWRAGMDA